MLGRVIELAILGVLKESELHGYELKKRLREVMGPLSRVSFGSLYPALSKLEQQGYVKAVEAAGAGPARLPVAMTGSLSGEAAAFRAARRLATRGPRGKKVYGITPEGEARLADLIAEASPSEQADDRTFALKLAFCRWTEPEVRLALLRRRRATLEARLTEGRRALTGRSLDRYVRSLMEHDTESTERDIAWLDDLISQEETA
jgi:DNA-binding PadR family transcriptional regulator